jgi:hypothetical protein
MRDGMSLRQEVGMKIVVWKAPRFLRGLLRTIFGVKE